MSKNKTVKKVWKSYVENGFKSLIEFYLLPAVKVFLHGRQSAKSR